VFLAAGFSRIMPPVGTVSGFLKRIEKNYSPLLSSKEIKNEE